MPIRPDRVDALTSTMMNEDSRRGAARGVSTLPTNNTRVPELSVDPGVTTTRPSRTSAYSAVQYIDPQTRANNSARVNNMGVPNDTPKPSGQRPGNITNPGTDGNYYSGAANYSVGYNTPSSTTLDSLINKLSAPGYDKEYSNLMEGQLRQELMNTAGASRSELANRLGAAGVEGGVAMDTLAGVDRSAAQGMASGMASIRQKVMEQGYADRQAALSASLQKYGIDAQTANQMASLQVQKELGLKGLDLERELGLGQLDVTRRGQDIDERLGLGQLDVTRRGQDINKDLGWGQLNLDKELGTGQLDLGRDRLNLDELLGTTDREIAIEQINQQYGLKTQEDQMNFAISLLQLAQLADAEESQRLMQIAWEILNQPASNV